MPPARRKPASRARRPEVAVNFAVTWDGRISTRNKTPADFSSPRDKHRLLEIRATGDALLVGKNTVQVDNMRMGLPDETLRGERIGRGKPPCPLRVIVSNTGQIDPGLRVFETDDAPILIFSTARMPVATRAALEKKAALHLCETSEVDARAMLEKLGRDYAVRRVVCEGGPTLFRSLIGQRLVDEINVTFCPRIFGGDAAPSITGLPGEFLDPATECRLEKMEMIEGECFARYRVAG